MTLADLVLLDEKNSAPAHAKIDFVEAAGVDNLFLAGLGIDSIFYAVLGVCGFVIAIRAVVSILRALKEERLRASQRSYEPRGNVSRRARANIELAAAARGSSPGRSRI